MTSVKALLDLCLEEMGDIVLDALLGWQVVPIGLGIEKLPCFGRYALFLKG